MKCNICPRKCNIDRDKGTGYCLCSNEIMAARAALHMWEEPCISGDRGSGAVFFTGCNLRCVFCQNYDIAAAKKGKVISIERLAEIFLELQDKGANNINLVTPGHFAIQIIDALHIAKNNGLKIPIVYNTGAYEEVETIKLFDGLVDVYLPDLKYVSSELSGKYSNAGDYFIKASAVIKEMVRQTGKPQFFDKSDRLVKDKYVEEDIMKKGVIVRHLVLPENTKDSKEVVKYLYDTYKDDIYISIMNQYTPLKNVREFPEINRKVTEEEYDSVVDYAIDIGVNNGFIQEGETAKESYIPDFDYEGIL